jgi:sarcosine oxidase
MYDVIVVGLGAMGSAALYHLAARGRRVLGIDQFTSPHDHGSSHGDTRIIRQALGEGDAYMPLVLRAYELWRGLEQASGRDLLVTTGGLTISAGTGAATHHAGEGFLDRKIAFAKAYGIIHRVLDAKEITTEFPQFVLSGTERGYYEEGTGLLRARDCVAAHLALAEHLGAHLRQNERVIAIEPAASGDRVTVHTTVGVYEAGRAILAAGPWLSTLLDDDLGHNFRVYRQLQCWFDAGDAAPQFATGSFPVFSWEFADGSDRFLYGAPAVDGPGGGVKVATEQFIETTPVEESTTPVTAAESAALYQDYVAGHLPGLTPRCVRTIAGPYTVTPDFQFVIDAHPRHPQLFLASPCSGHGFKHSAAIGELLAQLTTDGSCAIDISAFGLRRFATA